MAATTPKNATEEGHDIAILLRKVFVLNPNLDFRAASEFAKDFAEMLGYRDMKIGIPFVEAMIEALLSKESPEELKQKYAAGVISLEQFNKAILKAIEAPQDE